MRAVEEALGAELFRRHPRGLALTDLGAAMVDPARAMHEAAGRIALTAAGHQEALEGTVRITASVAMSLHHMPRIIAGMRQAEPLIQIELVPSDESRNLLFREADIAVRMYRPSQPDLIARHLGDMALGLYGAKSYLDRVGHPTSLDEALKLDFVGYDALPLLIDGFAEAGITVTRDWFPVRCDDHATYWELVRAGAGLGFGQRPMAALVPDIEEIETGFPLPPLPVWLTAHERMRRTPRLRRVWDMLVDGLTPLLSERSGI